jgi:hypothetical protein
VRGGKLTGGEVVSCGCFKLEQQRKAVTTHGESKTPIWFLWRGIKNRCYNKNTKEYPNYGGRGIAMHSEWIDSFELFRDSIPAKPVSSRRLSLDRIDNSKGYIPGNLKWSTYSEQNSNKRSTVWITVDGLTKTQAQWDSFLGKSQNYVRQMAKKWRIPKADVIRRAMA